MTTARTNILANVQTTLEGITVANGYNTDVVTVEGVVRDWGEVNAILRPWIGFIPQTTTYSYEPGGRIRSVMRLLVFAHLSSASKAAASVALDNLQDDLIAAMNADTTRGENAVMSTLVDAQDDIGDPDSKDSNGIVTVTMQSWDIVYYRTTGST